VFTASDYRGFAEECLQSARAAKSAARRKHFMDMVKLWTEAAASLEGGDMLHQMVQTMALEQQSRSHTFLSAASLQPTFPQPRPAIRNSSHLALDRH
jgi:hypothetical protein